MTDNIRKMISDWITITLAAIIAIAAAGLLHLDFAVSAGIVAILSIQATKKETIRTAGVRVAAFTCALLISFVSYSLVGFNIYGFLLYLPFYVAVCVNFSWYSAIAMNSVLISHFITLGDMGLNSLGNELILFALGVITGIIANMRLHRNLDHVGRLRNEADEQIRHILSRMADRILDTGVQDYNGSCFDKLNDMLSDAYSAAKLNHENIITAGDTNDMEYIKMRQRQCSVLYEMYKKASALKATPATAQRIADFLRHTAREFSSDNTVAGLLAEFGELDKSMKSEPLPVTRSEFEERAMLYALLRDLEQFLRIKNEFMTA